ncbi:recombinase RecT [Pseudomonas sp. MWU12-3103b]|uniref:recombinase RecT n=1 Tax=Pseudomonas sp. MWU12-3103b TaxID=2928857 RepID=UPI00200020AE|nr:recombinase RecT [Pseudomonas sp. MWU12-3103b]
MSQTTLAAMQTSAVAAPKNDAPMSLLTGAGFDQIQRVAKALAGSTLVPVQYRAFTEVKEYGKVVGHQPNGAGLPNCIVAMNMAQRMGADPLMVMQNLHVIEGRPSWSSQFVIAALNSCGRFSPLRFELSKPGKTEELTYSATFWKDGKKVTEQRKATVKHRTCIAWTVERGVNIPQFTPEELRKNTQLELCRQYGVPVIEGPEISIQMAIDEGWLTKNGSKWLTMPEVMLRYRAASMLGRLYAPELLMGLQTREEVEDFIEATPDGAGNYTVDVNDLRNREPEPPSVVDSDDDLADENASDSPETATETAKTATNQAETVTETDETDTKPADTGDLQFE